MILRRIIDNFLRLCRETNQLISQHAISKITYFPQIATEEQLAEILNRANWYFPQNGPSLAQISIPISKELLQFSEKLEKLKTPSSEGKFISKNTRVKLTVIEGKKQIEDLCKDSDSILVWDMEKFSSVPQLLRALSKIRIVDKNYYWVTEARNYIWAYNSTLPKKEMKRIKDLSDKNFYSLLQQAKKYKNAYVFGTGPSVAGAYKFDFSDGLRIVANTIINDPKLSDHIKPNVDVFGDFVYHVGPSKYAAKFRSQLSEACKKGCYALCRQDVLPLMLMQYPEMENKLIGVPIKLFVGPNILSKDKFYVKLSNNSLVGWMLPLSSAVADNIFILGCDGRKRGDKMFWGHAKTTHYDDLTQTLVDTHPSAFNNTDYSAFSRQYEQDAEEMISYGESLGKRYVCLANSYIPALQKRMGTKNSQQ